MTTISSSIPIEVTLSPEVSTESMLGTAKLRITLTNTSPHEVFILRWNSPLDLSLAAVGTVTFTSTKMGTKAICLDMKINRRVPPEGYFAPDDQSIVRIAANRKVGSMVEFNEPKVALVKGEEYKAKAEGFWMGVWINETDQKIEILTMGEEMRMGEFESNEIVVKA